MLKKLTGIVLTLCMVLSMFAVVSVPEAQAASLASNVQSGQILQCWNWSFNNIKNNMSKIASQGFSAIQTTPIQPLKESTTEYYSSAKNQWWVYYQPVDFAINTASNNGLGTKSEFAAMCSTAHSYGVKVIVDAVLNHTANASSSGGVHYLVPSGLRDNSNCWHTTSTNISNYSNRYDITHYCMSGLPDLNSGDTVVQGYAINFLRECIDAGADGFRFDAAKHIETDSDSYGIGSDFWPVVLNNVTSYAQSRRGITPYYYGEILDGFSNMGIGASAYTKYMSITDNTNSNYIRNSINSGNASGAACSGIGNGASPSKTVQWNESHDTYAEGSSKHVSDHVLKRTWAMVGTRSQVCGMYLARPSQFETGIGYAETTAWASPEVKAINDFKNSFIGQGEYLSSYGSIAYNERGTTGVVLVNAAGGSTTVNVPSHVLTEGIYTDAITGKNFVVQEGKISGTMGDSGIAVLTRTSAFLTGEEPGTIKVYFDNSQYNWSTVYCYVYTDLGDYISWPGGIMTYNPATGLHEYVIPPEFANGSVIFSNGAGSQYPPSGQPGLQLNGTDMLLSGSTWGEYDAAAAEEGSVKVYFDNSEYNWSIVYCYVYSDTDEYISWPGGVMTYNASTGLYEYTVPKAFANGYVIFSDGNGNQYPPSGQTGLKLDGTDMMLKGTAWSSCASSTSLTLSASELGVDEGQTSVLTASNARGAVTVTSSDPSVATVSASASSTKKSKAGTDTATDTTTGTTTGDTANKGDSFVYGNPDATGDEAIDEDILKSFDIDVAAVGAGETIITARDAANGKTARCKVTVSDDGTITLSDYDVELEEGKVYYVTEDAENDVEWSTSDSGVLSVSKMNSQKGKFLAVAEGEIIVTVRDPLTGKFAECRVRVVPAKINIAPKTLKIFEGKSAFISENSPSAVTWTSSNPAVATVSRYNSAKGKVVGVSEGTATITVTDKRGTTATCEVTVEKKEEEMVDLKLSATEIITEVGRTSYITENSPNIVTWTSSDPGVVTASRYNAIKGKITAVAEGTAIITATDTTGATATCKVTVKPGSITISPVKIVMNVGKFRYVFEDTINPVEWSSSNPGVASVERYSTAQGKITGHSAGTAIITVTDTVTGEKASCTVVVK